MAHMWHRVQKGLRVAGKVAGALGTAALAAHAIHRAVNGHDSQQWSHSYPGHVEDHGIAKTVKF